MAEYNTQIDLPIERMAELIFPSDLNQMTKLFAELKSGKEFKPLSHKYNQIADRFTGAERLMTRGFRGGNFPDFCSKYAKGEIEWPSVLKCIREYPKQSLLHALKYAFNLYFGYIGNFAMWNAVNFYKKYKPKIVLDPTAGFGNRLVAAAATGVERYIGIDSNKNLEEPYKGLVEFLSNKSDTKVQMIINNSLNVDYTQLTYDCVFTSLPYYTVENYNHMHNYGTKQQWNDDFYKPLIRKTYDSLAPNGVYALNVPGPIYESCCVPILGQCLERIPLAKKQRKEGKGGDYGEFIYVWRKTG
jgi:hypothetical protein